MSLTLGEAGAINQLLDYVLGRSAVEEQQVEYCACVLAERARKKLSAGYDIAKFRRLWRNPKRLRPGPTTREKAVLRLAWIVPAAKWYEISSVLAAVAGKAMLPMQKEELLEKKGGAR